MRPETRQTLIGVVGLTVVFSVALTEGYNGRVAVAYGLAVIAITSPEALSHLPIEIEGRL